MSNERSLDLSELEERLGYEESARERAEAAKEDLSRQLTELQQLRQEENAGLEQLDDLRAEVGTLRRQLRRKEEVIESQAAALSRIVREVHRE